MLNLQELSVNIFVLTVLQSIIQHLPVLKKYNNDTKFNYYRAIMCLTFTIMGLNIMTNHFTEGFAHPFSFKHSDMNELYLLFFGYLIVDLVKMVALKNTRIDLYAHHILCIGSLLIAYYTNRFGYIQSILLICESLSIVAGIDALAMEDKDDIMSYKCKKIRKFIIKYIRIPIWLILFIFTIRYTNKTPSLLWYDGLLISIGMIYLDKYWENKCNKVILLYEKNTI